MITIFAEYTARLRDFIRRRSSFVASVGDEGCNHEFDRLALELFGLQFAHNPAYRKFCQARKASPETIKSWTEIPALPAVGFKELEMTCLPLGERTHVFHSSGMTGQLPSRHFHNAESLAIYEASLLPWFAAQVLADSAWAANNQAMEFLPTRTSSHPLSTGEGRGEGRGITNQSHATKSRIKNAQYNFLALTPSPAQAPHSSLVHMFETIRQEFGSPASTFTSQSESDGSWNLDLDKTLNHLRDAIGSNSPVILLGTAFSHVHLLDHLKDNGIRLKLPPGSRALETGGYKGRSRSLPKAELHQLITDWLGVPESRIVCEYGMSELSSQAYDSIADGTRNGGRTFHFPTWARAQIISPETGREAGEGETGLLRIFDLANVYSVMAIQTEDLGVSRGGGFELFGRAAVSEPRGCSLQSA